MARIHFILDPVHPRLGPEWPYEEKKISELTQDFQIGLVRGRMHAAQLAREAKRGGAELVVCLGTDLSLNEIINALYPFDEDTPVVSFHPRYQVGSVLASLGMEKDFFAFIQRFLKGEAKEDRVDLAEIDFTGNFGQSIRRVFLESASFGFASSIVSRMNFKHERDFGKYDLIKLLLRKLPFYREPGVQIQADQLQPERLTLLTAFINNTAYTARGIRVSPRSDPRDGTLELTRIKKARFYQYLGAAIPFYAGHRGAFSFIDSLKFKELKIDALSGRKIRLDYDGEFRGFLPATIRVKEKALRLLK